MIYTIHFRDVASGTGRTQDADADNYNEAVKIAKHLTKKGETIDKIILRASSIFDDIMRDTFLSPLEH